MIIYFFLKPFVQVLPVSSLCCREEEGILKEIAELRVLERSVEEALTKVTTKVEVKEESGVIKQEPGIEQEGEEGRTLCLLCDNCPLMQTNSDLLRHLVEKHFKQKMYAKLIYKATPVTAVDKTVPTVTPGESGSGGSSRGTYKCPLCDFENPNQMNTARHYGIKHRFAHKAYEDIICRPMFSTAMGRESGGGGFFDGRSAPRVGRPPFIHHHSVQPIVKQEKSQPCKICKVEHDSMASYQRHLIKVHFKTKLLNSCPKAKPFVCPNEGCNIERRDRFNLLMHFGGCQRKVWKILEEMPEDSIEHLNDTSKSKCRICGKYFTSARYMWGHLGEDHFQVELDAELPKAAPWKCPKCPLENAYSGMDLRSLRIHYGTRHKAVMPHLAQKLNIPLDELKREFMPIGGEATGGLTCQFCGKSFHNQMDYYKHSLLHVRKRVYQDLPESEPFQCPRCPFVGGSRITLLLHYGLQHNVVAELLKEDPATLMVDMDFIVKQENGGPCEEERLHAAAAASLHAGTAHMPDKYPELDNKRFPKCKLCNYRYYTQLDLYRHFADNHLREKLCSLLGPDPGKYALHRCPEQACGAEMKTRQLAWRHLASRHGHLLRLMETEFKFNMDEWSKPMKDSDMAKAADEKKRALEAHSLAVKQHQEASHIYQEAYSAYQHEMQAHQALVMQARQQAAQEQAETLAAQALASMAGLAPYHQPRPMPQIHVPPPPVPPQPPAALQPAPTALRPVEDPSCLDVTVLPTLEYLDNPKASQNICELCGEEFTNTNKTRDKGNHQVNHFRDNLLQALPQNTFDCPKCSFTGRDRNALLKHVGLSHRVVTSAVRKEMGGTVQEINEVTHDCKVCSQFFLNQNALNNHLCDAHYFSRLARDVSYSAQPPFKCPKCAYEAKSHQMTVRHYGVKHGLLKQFMIEDGYVPREPTPPPPPPPPPPASVSRHHMLSSSSHHLPSYPEVNLKQSLMNHLSGQQQQLHHYGHGGFSHHQSPRYQPAPTPAWMDHYGNSPQQQQHQHHMRQEEVSITCPILNCNQSFANAQLLCRHATEQHFCDRFARELPIVPPFACPLCGKNYPDQMSLIRHWGVTHQMAVKVFNEQMGRTNSFDTSVLKKYEVRGVAGGYRETCPLCKGSFQGRQLLLRHLADTHFKDRMCNNMPDREGLVYQCPQCAHVARDRQSFVRHYGIVHRMVVKYLNEMGIHSLDDDGVVGNSSKGSAPPSPAAAITPAVYGGSGHNDSFSPRYAGEPVGSSPSYYSPHSHMQTPQRSPYHDVVQQQQYTSPFASPQYKSPQYVGHSPRNASSIASSPQDLSMQYSTSGPSRSLPPTAFSQFEARFGQPQDLSASSSQPQDLSMATQPQDLSAKAASQPLDFSSHGGHHVTASPYHQQSQPVNLVQQQASVSQQYHTASSSNQKPLKVLVNDPYRQPPMTPGGSQHSNPGTPQPSSSSHMGGGSQPGTPQPLSAAPSPASSSGYRLSAAPSPAAGGSYRQPDTPQPVYAHQVAADFGGGGGGGGSHHPVIQTNPQHSQPIIMPGHSASSAFQVIVGFYLLLLCLLTIDVHRYFLSSNK